MTLFNRLIVIKDFSNDQTQAVFLPTQELRETINSNFVLIISFFFPFVCGFTVSYKTLQGDEKILTNRSD